MRLLLLRGWRGSRRVVLREVEHADDFEGVRFEVEVERMLSAEAILAAKVRAYGGDR